ncbi:hypothetical protein, conserved [Trypanosoma brucei brucei TREU927]|uniref:Phosphatidylinositol N-acetylglucosaminyltransferase subunit H conserved domain-containing protein n=2 Tax=Trypanozoon TaxID=39700 RepID=Q57U98_TRYB2|nr:hypothetical protein, conserved [Trypanosoma brucei brucei TREU927]AAX70821.1 hypothetical protein, conserved [Trypanosoma brucei]AAZ11479.1 hypothetical protein, conserved [Trypanosoma brucei brucei TREU927]
MLLKVSHLYTFTNCIHILSLFLKTSVHELTVIPLIAFLRVKEPLFPSSAPQIIAQWRQQPAAREVSLSCIFYWLGFLHISPVPFRYTLWSVYGYRVFMAPPISLPSLRSVDRSSTKVLVAGHISAVNTVLDVFQMDYSESVRMYRVCRRGKNGFAKIFPFLRPVYANIALLIIVVGCLVGSQAGLRGVLPNIPQSWVSWSKWTGSGTAEHVVMWQLSCFHIFILGCLFLLILQFVRNLFFVHVDEVTAIRGLGLQLNSYNALGRLCFQRFVDIRLIRSLVIHDAFFRTQVLFFLSATVENEASRLVLFEETLPRLDVLQPVLCGLRHVLFGEPEDVVTEDSFECQTATQNVLN